MGSAPRAFDSALRQHEAERHRRIIERSPSFTFPSRNPPGYRAENIAGGARSQGFVSVPEAARLMGISEAEIVRLPREWKIETEDGLVRPAIVSVLGVTS